MPARSDRFPNTREDQGGHRAGSADQDMVARLSVEVPRSLGFVWRLNVQIGDDNESGRLDLVFSSGAVSHNRPSKAIANHVFQIDTPQRGTQKAKVY